MASFFYIQDKIHGREKVVRAEPGSQLLYCEIEEIVGLKECWFGVPYAIEVDGWGELACVGETYEPDDDEFLVEAISSEEYYEYMKY